jgi:hypothetical protein
LCRQALSTTPIISEGKTEVNKPIKWGMYAEQPTPYYVGWVSFRATAAVLAPLLNL